MDDTAELVEECKRGNPTAFESIFNKYKFMVFRDALLMTGIREKADDVLQDVFLTIWKSIGKYNPQKAKFVSWLHRITINKCIDYYRKEKKRFSELEDNIYLDKNSLLEDIIVNNDNSERLITAMKSLDTNHRSIIILRYWDDLSYKDISEVIEIPIGTVKSRIHNALCMLRGLL